MLTQNCIRPSTMRERRGGEKSVGKDGRLTQTRMSDEKREAKIVSHVREGNDKD